MKFNACAFCMVFFDSLICFWKFCLGRKKLSKTNQGSIVQTAKKIVFLKFIENSYKKLECYFHHYFTCNRFSKLQCVMTCKIFCSFFIKKKNYEKFLENHTRLYVVFWNGVKLIGESYVVQLFWISNKICAKIEWNIEKRRECMVHFFGIHPFLK